MQQRFRLGFEWSEGDFSSCLRGEAVVVQG